MAALCHCVEEMRPKTPVCDFKGESRGKLYIHYDDFNNDLFILTLRHDLPSLTNPLLEQFYFSCLLVAMFEVIKFFKLSLYLGLSPADCPALQQSRSSQGKGCSKNCDSQVGVRVTVELGFGLGLLTTEGYGYA